MLLIFLSIQKPQSIQKNKIFMIGGVSPRNHVMVDSTNPVASCLGAEELVWSEVFLFSL